MSTFEVRATVSHRYYMSKTKDEIITRIFDMREMLDLFGTKPYPPEATHWRNHLMNNNTKADLARLAMRMHDCFPDNP